MPIQSWLLFIAIALVPAVSPGPGMLLALSNSLRYGPRSVIYSGLGNSIGLTLLGFAVAFGLSALLAVSASAFTVIKIIGAAYLLYLGFKLWRDGKSFLMPGAGEVAASRSRLFRQAFLVSITNPKAMILLAALIPPFVAHNQPILPQAAVMSLTYAGLCYATHLILAFAGGKIRRFLSSDRRVTAVRRVIGSMFIGFGAVLAASSR